MSDIIDQANERVAIDTQRAIEAARRVDPSVPQSGGLCLNCGEAISPVKRWCDPDCREDWLSRQPPRRGV